MKEMPPLCPGSISEQPSQAIESSVEDSEIQQPAMLPSFEGSDTLDEN
jgi:hypothetical protein